MKRNNRIKKYPTFILITLLTIGILIVPSIAFADKVVQPLGFPTEIDAQPYYQEKDRCCGGNCCLRCAHWDLYLAGGMSGPYKITVGYGDGEDLTWYVDGTYDEDTHAYYVCVGNQTVYNFNQT